MYRIFDSQTGRYKWDWTVFTTIRDMIESLADFHNIDWTEWKVNQDLLERLDEQYKTNKERLDYLIEYWQWRVIEKYKYLWRTNIEDIIADHDALKKHIK